MGVMSKVMNLLGLQDEDEMLEQDQQHGEETFREDEFETPAQEMRNKGKANIVSIHSQKNIRVMLTEPRSYEEAPEIADYLRSRRPVVLNLHRARPDHASRIFDFLSGTVYALNGSISKIGPNIFLCTPDSVEVQGAISELLQSAEAHE